MIRRSEEPPRPVNLQQLLDNIRELAKGQEKTRMGDLLDAAGQPSFGPLLLLAGIVTVAPLIGDIPGVPTLVSLFVFLVAVQLLMKRNHVWLPQKLLDYSISTGKINKILDWAGRIAKHVDRWIRPRMTRLTQGAGTHLVAALCLLIAMAMPVMELVPFSANAAGAALIALGLSLMAHDGLWAALAFAIVVATAGIGVYNLF